MQKVSVVQDESSHWYTLPSELVTEFYKDGESEEFADSGGFDKKYGIVD